MASAPKIDINSLTQIFRDAEKPLDRWRVGMEAEKFGVYCPGSKPLTYEGERGVVGVFEFLSTKYGYSVYRETEDGPPIALQRGDASITLEPGAQFELSGSPHDTLHGVFAEFGEHYVELAEVRERFGLRFLHLGFHPLNTLEELPWIPKRRYPVMRKYLPTKGSRGLDMMQRTATVQANLDYSSEEDAMQKLVTLLRLSPVIAGMTLNAPFYEGRVSRLKSERQDVWLNMDPARSGLLPALWSKKTPKYEDYVKWALQAGMFLFYRDGEALLNTGQTFASFIEDGYEGHKPTAADWELHLGTLFPQIRLKKTLEIRCCDCLPLDLSVALPALAVGLTYDKVAFEQARVLADRISYEDAHEAELQLPSDGLQTPIGESTLQRFAEELIDIARGGLIRRAQLDASGHSEAQYLDNLSRLVGQGRTPADQLLFDLKASQLDVPAFISGPCR
jgi:glutamate--cysteine ligase